jgi:crotonobetainyl-CoA:carnitine CoA-transferase CaiB-like acyl-CoA transferase
MVVNRDANQTPRKVGIWLVDVATGIYAAQATGAALYRRATQGRGEHVQVSLLAAAAAIQGNAIVDAVLAEGRPVLPVSVPAGTFATADGHINVTSLHERMFAGLCRAIGQDAWLQNPHFATAEARFGHITEINEALDRIFRANTTAHWLDVLRRNSVVCGPVSGYGEFLADAQVRHEQLFQEITQAGFKPVPVPRVPGVQRSIELKRAPRVGEHAVEVLSDLGLSKAEIEALFESGAIASAAAKA